MEWQLVLLIVFGVILALSILGALGMYISGEKGRSTTRGFLIGLCVPLLGLIWLAFESPTDAQVQKDMYDRDMMSLDDYKKTQEFNPNEKKA